MSVQLILLFLCRRIGFRQLFISGLLFFSSLFLSNLWWLAPYSVTLGNVSDMVDQSKQTIGGSLKVAIANSNVINIISGFPEGTNGTISSVMAQISLLGLFVLAMFVMVFAPQKINPGLILIILLTVFLTKGSNLPFGNIFDYFYAKVPLMQIIRRPASKLYWIFIFFILSSVAQLLSSTSKKQKPLSFVINTTLVASSILALFINYKNLSLKPFNIPSSYWQVAQKLSADGAEKILLLPDLKGANPDYNSQLNNYRSIDFFSQVVEQKKYLPNTFFSSVDNPELALVNRLAATIYQGEDFCSLSGKLAVSHIVIRKDLLPTNYNPELVSAAEKFLDSSKQISKREVVGSNFLVYQLNDTCRQNLLTGDDDWGVAFQKENKTKIRVRIRYKSDQTHLIYREKYSSSWVLHDGSLSGLLSQLLPWHFPGKKTVFTHDTALDYANRWTVNLADYCRQNKTNCHQADGVTYADLVIEYWPQRLFYLGFWVSALYGVVCLGYLIYSTKQKC